MPTPTDVIETWLRSDLPAVIFDFNGTLSDDEPILFDIFSELFRVHLDWAMTAEDYRDDLLGRSDREIIEHAVSRHGRGTDRKSPSCCACVTASTSNASQTRPNRRRHRASGETVGRQRDSLGIVTGAQRDDVLAVLAGSPAGELFGVLIAEEDVREGKPHPEGFLTAARLLHRHPSDVLVFEDSVPGVQAAEAAGMHCVAVAAEPSTELQATAKAIVADLSVELVEHALIGWRRGRAPHRRPGT